MNSYTILKIRKKLDHIAESNAAFIYTIKWRKNFFFFNKRYIFLSFLNTFWRNKSFVDETKSFRDFILIDWRTNECGGGGDRTELYANYCVKSYCVYNKKCWGVSNATYLPQMRVFGVAYFYLLMLERILQGPASLSRWRWWKWIVRLKNSNRYFVATIIFATQIVLVFRI